MPVIDYSVGLARDYFGRARVLGLWRLFYFGLNHRTTISVRNQKETR
jgi:hypothetical protein